jgi:hypothetical protein
MDRLDAKLVKKLSRMSVADRYNPGKRSTSTVSASAMPTTTTTRSMTRALASGAVTLDPEQTRLLLRLEEIFTSWTVFTTVNIGASGVVSLLHNHT